MSENIKTKDFYFDLPAELIAQDPLENRSASRLLVLDKKTGVIKHDSFKNIAEYLNPGDCLVLNNTKVIPARLLGEKVDTGTPVEVLLLKRGEAASATWEAMVKPGRKCRVGAVIKFGEGILTGTVVEVLEDGNRRIKFSYQGIFEEVLDELGEMPLPPYITNKLKDKNRYQTVYAKHEGSAAAPTAGLHFTEELLNSIQDKGVKLAFVTLHVGLGTFRPVKVENAAEHHMHSEYYEVSDEVADIINETKAKSGRVICVGTTSLRTVESAAKQGDGSSALVVHKAEEPSPCFTVTPSSGDTSIFIYPGYQFKITDALITNFHLPESTLMMLVSALAGRENIMAAYQEAINEKYRFFSFGDAMLIL